MADLPQVFTDVTNPELTVSIQESTMNSTDRPLVIYSTNKDLESREIVLLKINHVVTQTTAITR